MLPFHTVTIVELTRWAKRIRYFRIIASEGYNSGSEDSLELYLRYSSEQELHEILNVLGLTLQDLSARAMVDPYGKKYTVDEFGQIEFALETMPGKRQPGHIKIFDQYVFMWIHAKIITIRISAKNGLPESVREDDIRAAEIIEQHIDSIKDKIIDPPVDSEHCFCPKYYPHAFNS